jgi:hypothetical protein
MVFLGVLVCFLNWRQLKLHQTLGLTTSVELLIVGFISGDEKQSLKPVQAQRARSRFSKVQ